MFNFNNDEYSEFNCSRYVTKTKTKFTCITMSLSSFKEKKNPQKNYVNKIINHVEFYPV